MPKVTRQTGNNRTHRSVIQKFDRHDILSEAISVSEMEDCPIKMVIYGQNRVGKTHLACLFPKPLLLVCFEPAKSGGARTVKKFPGVEFIRIGAKPDSDDSGRPYGTKKALLLAEQLKENCRFKTVVIDSATSYQDIVLQEILDLEAVPEQLNWGMVSRDQYRERSEKTRECLRPFLDLPCNTVVTAKERDHNPPDSDRDKPKILRGTNADGSIGQMTIGSFFAADLGGATVGWLHDACDYIGRLYFDKEVKEVTRKIRKPGGKTVEKVELVETGRIVRRLRTMFHPNFAAGFRSENPESVPEYIEDPDWEKIDKVIRGIKLNR